jgi:hypothetical protein
LEEAFSYFFKQSAEIVFFHKRTPLLLARQIAFLSDQAKSKNQAPVHPGQIITWDSHTFQAVIL